MPRQHHGMTLQAGTKHVDTAVSSFQDGGSTPPASMLRLPATHGGALCSRQAKHGALRSSHKRSMGSVSSQRYYATSHRRSLVQPAGEAWSPAKLTQAKHGLGLFTKVLRNQPPAEPCAAGRRSMEPCEAHTSEAWARSLHKGITQPATGGALCSRQAKHGALRSSHERSMGSFMRQYI